MRKRLFALAKTAKSPRDTSMRKRFTIPSVLQLLITIGLIGFFLIQAGMNSSQLILKELQQQMMRQVNDQLSGHMHTAMHLNQMHADLMQCGLLDLESTVQRERYFSSHIKSYPDVAMTFIGQPDGSFYGARRTMDGEIQVVRNDSTTQGASRYYRITSSGEGVALADEFPNFDPRTRPWYTQAVETGKPVFSSVYSHFVFREPTISASHPVYDQNGRLIGVFGVDYLLSWLGETLGSLPIGDSGQVFVTDNMGMLIATSFDGPAYRMSEGGSQLIPAKDSDSTLIQAALDLREEEYEKSLPGFTVAGEKYFVGRSTFQERGVNWNIYVVSAENDFLGGVKQSVVHTVIILAVSLLISVFLMSWIGRRVTRPLVTLSKAADELAGGNLTPIPDSGRRDEIGALTRAFNDMGLRLTNMVTHLEDEVATRTQELKERNEELGQLNELRETFFDADTSYVFLKDENLKYVFVNKAMKEFMQLPYDAIIGHDDFALVEREFAEICTGSDRDALEQCRLIISTTAWNNRFFRTTKFPVRMPNGVFGVGAYISDITEEYKNQQIRERMLKGNELLLDVLGRSFGSTQEQLDYALHGLLELSQSQYGYIYFYDEKKEEFTLNSWTQGVMAECAVQGEPKIYQLAHTGIWGEVVRQRKPIIVNDFNTPNPLKKGYPEGHVALKRFMSVPVFIDDQIVAVVGFGNKQTDYNDTDVYEMTMLMSGVWNAVQRRESLETLAYERGKYFQTLLSIGDGVIVIDRNRNIEMLNEVACDLTGWRPEEAAGVDYKKVFVLSYEQEGFTVDDPIEKVFLTGETQELGNHAILTSKNGMQFHLEDSAAPIMDNKGTLAGVVLVFRDVTEKKEQRKKIEYISFHDSLTGLYNRRFFEDELRRIDTERNLPISILMGDVNSLKLTNDIFGHAFGDMLLERIAEVMRSVCRADDIIARWGGDEFVLLLPKTSPEEAERIAERIKQEVSTQQIRAVKGSISLGHDAKIDPSDDITQVLSSAEAKMYTIKALERDETLSQELDTLISTLFEKSEYEKEHAARVSSLCQRLGRALRLPESDIQMVTESGRLHDIGKIVLDPALLKKGYQLNPEEWHEMNQHPIIGYRILNSFHDTLKLAEVVLSHHENWDGSGYPKGLKEESIPLLVRIISVAESYDRMVHTPDGPRIKSSAEAIQELQRCAGAQFDPDIVAAFVNCVGADGNPNC
ncbi:diguanylate cyclase [Lacrimispora amygdalina]|uniref:Diguanylate cyclase n=1 Tax=Lacrimispora amygdalina TaxID=253257 RepID=A0A3E2N9Y8_9FIRM|nr:diguanylate cyclase [Clostridium indicum]RFZ77835.1 diguanylate cyclase [Clostridium indicum]